MTASEMTKIAGFEARFLRSQTTEIVDLPWGYALLHSDFPTSHMHNRVMVTSAMSSEEILATADEILGRAGCSHRHLSILNDEVGRALANTPAAADYEHVPLTTMVYRGGEPPTEPAHQVTALPLDVLRPAVQDHWRREFPTASEDVIAQLVDRMALYDRVVDVTHLAVYQGPDIAARVELFIDAANGIAQIESLNTHPDHRGHGYAKSLLLEAQRRALAANCEISYLVAAAKDWPRTWYQRLGYVAERTTHEFTLTQ